MSEIVVPEGTILSRKTLIGVDGNAFSVMGVVRKGLKHARNSQSVIDSFTEQAMSGDYNHLLAVAIAFTDEDAMFNFDEECFG